MLLFSVPQVHRRGARTDHASQNSLAARHRARNAEDAPDREGCEAW